MKQDILKVKDSTYYRGVDDDDDEEVEEESKAEFDQLQIVGIEELNNYKDVILLKKRPFAVRQLFEKVQEENSDTF